MRSLRSRIRNRSREGVYGLLLAPVAREGENTYFAFAEASSDGHSHFSSMGSGIIGLEDLAGLGDRDFDDMLIQLKDLTLVAI